MPGYEDERVHGFAMPDENPDAALFSAPAGQHQAELKGVYYLHGRLAQALGELHDDYVSLPRTSWQLTAVELKPFGELEDRYAEKAVWGLWDFQDQPGGAFLFLDGPASLVLTGVPTTAWNSAEGQGVLETWLHHAGAAFAAAWQEVASFEVQPVLSLEAPGLGDLQGMFPGLNRHTVMITSAFRVGTARVVLAVPQAYLISVGTSLKALGEAAFNLSDPSAFQPRLQAMGDLPVPVRVLLGKAVMSVGELNMLEEGDVIELDALVGQPLRLRMGNLNFLGRPGTSADGRRLAVQIVSRGS